MFMCIIVSLTIPFKDEFIITTVFRIYQMFLHYFATHFGWLKIIKR